ncbi:MAG: class II fumarate hydratase [Candidatus Peregrinibacteria bacterium]
MVAAPPPLYGKETALAIQNFPISGIEMPSEFLSALALIKEHAAAVNGELGLIPASCAEAIEASAQAIRRREHHDQFPIDIFQTGSGTSTNMNMNEVIAHLASKDGQAVHPNDHVNRCQSSNDVIPTAIQIACAQGLRDALLPALTLLAESLETKGAEFRDIIKTARTHLMDAVPVRLGDEFLSYASLVRQGMHKLTQSISDLCVLPLGGTAAGTGLNADKRFAPAVIERLAKETGLALREVENHIAAQSCPLAFSSVAGALKETTTALTKIASDIRLMGSGPVAGLAELFLPALQAGSSIMPGKVNPVLCESVLQVAMEITGMDATVHAGLAIGSAFELNTAMPVIAHSLLSGIRHLANVSAVFEEKCVRGIEANRALISERSGKNPMLATALNPLIGYDQSAAIVKEALAKKETILAIAEKKTKIPLEKLQEALNPAKMCA